MGDSITFKKALYMIVLYGIFIGCLKVINIRKAEGSIKRPVFPSEEDITNSILKGPYPSFKNPIKAGRIIGALHQRVRLEEKHYAPFFLNTSKGFFGYHPDKNYCNKRMQYFTENTQDVFGTPNFLIPENEEAMTRKEITPLFGNIVDAHINEKNIDPNRENNAFWIKVNTTIFMPQTSIYRRRKYGSMYSCLSQASNKIPGEQALSRKDAAAASTIKYAEQFKDRPQCFSYNSLFPETWILYEEPQCREFFRILNSEEYAKKKEKQRIVYMRKVGAGAHRGKGVFPVNQEEEDFLRAKYHNGAACGKVKDNNIVQTFINDALLINDFYKFDFRVFMLVASTNPMIGFYHDGYIRISLIPYNSSNAEDEKKMMLTNLMLNKDIYDAARNGTLYRGMDEEGLMNAQQGTVESLGEYLREKGIVTDPNWVQNYLRREMKKAMVHLLRMAKPTFAVDSSLFQLFGIDFMLDSNLNLWFIEANGGPALPKYIPSVHKVMINMLKGQHEIVINLLRSRMKRVINYVNKISEFVGLSEDNFKVVIPDIETRKKEFAEINKNYLEKEFQISPENTWQKFMDENLEGPDRYAGLIDLECY